jgi:DNA-binding NtrC family response regulator
MLEKVVPLSERSPREHAQRTVLVVEDEVVIRMMVSDELRRYGFRTIEARDAHEAITLLQSRVSVDLVFTDIRLPGSIDGLALARLVREVRPDLNVIITSGDTAAANSLNGVGAFLPKPYDPRQVVKRIEELLGDAQR